MVFCGSRRIVITDAAHAGGHAGGVRGSILVRAVFRGVFGHGAVLFGGAGGRVHAADEEGDQLGDQGGDRAPCDLVGGGSAAGDIDRRRHRRACGVLPPAEDVPVHFPHSAGFSRERGVAGVEPCGVDPLLLHRPAVCVCEYGMVVRVHARHGVDSAVHVLHLAGGE